jgi:hypothetical protein
MRSIAFKARGIMVGEVTGAAAFVAVEEGGEACTPRMRRNAWRRRRRESMADLTYHFVRRDPKTMKNCNNEYIDDQDTNFSCFDYWNPVVVVVVVELEKSCTDPLSSSAHTHGEQKNVG